MSNDHLHNQLIKLGDMMGDGLHYESDGKWISKEYKRVFNALYPEHNREMRRAKTERTDIQMNSLISAKKCKCGGSLRQSRKGSIVAYCNVCNARYKATTKKK